MIFTLKGAAMQIKRLRASSTKALGISKLTHRAFPKTTLSGRKLRTTMPRNNSSAANSYFCAVEKNQNGKYNVRVRASFSSGGSASNSWSIQVYFLASSFNGAMKKLEESLQILQKNEEKLRFWGVERTDDPNFAGDLLREFGLWLDRRRDFPRKVAEFVIPSGRQVPASQLAQIRRTLADSVGQERFIYQAAMAGD